MGTVCGDLLSPCVCSTCRERERERPVRCGFATETSVGRSVAWACPVHAHAAALINDLGGDLLVGVSLGDAGNELELSFGERSVVWDPFGSSDQRELLEEADRH